MQLTGKPGDYERHYEEIEMSNDKELSELPELSREVYKQTGWGVDEKALTGHKLWHPKHTMPLYTSDYLLEKLTYAIKYNLELIPRHDGTWYAGYSQGQQFNLGEASYIFAEANTPLEALLKLTLALHEAGELHE